MNDDIQRVNWIAEVSKDGLGIRIEREKEGYVVWIGRVKMTPAPTLRMAIDAAMQVVA